jgi:hypothetical protein
MQNTLLRVFLASLLALVPGIASAQEVEEASCDKVRAWLAADSSADEVVQAVVATGITLAEATVFAMVCGGEENRVAIASAGVASAGNLAQAQFVADAVMAAAGQTGAVADAVRAAVKTYAENMPQPEVYQDNYTPRGGSVSPAI